MKDLTPLVQAFEPFAYSLEREPGRASFELNEPAEPMLPAALISEFVRLVNGLPSPARLVWDRAARRVFDIGAQSRRHPFSETYSLDAELLRGAGEIRADVAITLYALAEDDGPEPTAGQLLEVAATDPARPEAHMSDHLARPDPESARPSRPRRLAAALRSSGAYSRLAASSPSPSA